MTETSALSPRYQFFDCNFLTTQFHYTITTQNSLKSMNSVPMVTGRVAVKRRAISEPYRVTEMIKSSVEVADKPTTMGANSAYSFTNSPPLYIKPAPYSRLIISRLTPSPEDEERQTLGNITNLNELETRKPVIELEAEEEAEEGEAEGAEVEVEAEEEQEEEEDEQRVETSEQLSIEQEQNSHVTESAPTQSSSSLMFHLMRQKHPILSSPDLDFSLRSIPHNH